MKLSPRIRRSPLNSPAAPSSWPATCSIPFGRTHKKSRGLLPPAPWVKIQPNLPPGDDLDFRYRQVADHLVLADLVYYHFGGYPRRTGVELHRLVDALVSLLDALVVGHHIEGEFVPLRIGLLQGDLDVTHPLQCAVLRQRELEVISLSELSQGA